ncbi:MAG: hypothetical protein HQM09_21295 [Candidatus Riflebacteria bacterium]|nr:hypothetical protein [Candidatus Riflebacteria bacterium]
MSRFFLVMNPSSRSFRARFEWLRIFELLEAGNAEFDFALTRRDEDTSVLVHNAIKNGFDTVVAVGGDGTINEVINGLFEAESTVGAATLGVIYTGTSPDFCGYHGIPVDVEKAVDLLLSGKHRRVDVCRITHRHAVEDAQVQRIFSCCANFGLGAAVARGSNSGLRKIWGDAIGTFLSITLSVLKYSPPDFRVRIDGVESIIPGVFNIFVGKSPIIASGINLRMNISPDDGRLYFVPLHGISRAHLFAILPTIYTGSITERFVPKFPGEIDILDGGTASEVEYDGDPRGLLPAHISILPRALDLICP